MTSEALSLLFSSSESVDIAVGSVSFVEKEEDKESSGVIAAEEE